MKFYSHLTSEAATVGGGRRRSGMKSHWKFASLQHTIFLPLHKFLFIPSPSWRLLAVDLLFIKSVFEFKFSWIASYLLARLFLSLFFIDLNRHFYGSDCVDKDPRAKGSVLEWRLTIFYARFFFDVSSLWKRNWLDAERCEIKAEFWGWKGGICSVCRFGFKFQFQKKLISVLLNLFRFGSSGQQVHKTNGMGLCNVMRGKKIRNESGNCS